MTAPQPQVEHILVRIHAEHAVHPALDRARTLAAASGAVLTIVDVVEGLGLGRAPVPADIEERRQQDRRARVASIAQRVTEVPVRSRLLAGETAEALVREARETQADLIVRPSDGPARLDAGDVALLRSSPCPVLLHRTGPAAAGPVVGAVNASTLDAAERALGSAVVAWTRLVGGLERRTSVLLQAWEPFAERLVYRESSDDGFASYVEAMRSRISAELGAFVEAAGGGLQTALRRGAPERAIPDFVRAHGADIVVMGTMARGGLAGLVIGNTAERVLRALSCSVLVVTPAAERRGARAGLGPAAPST